MSSLRNTFGALILLAAGAAAMSDATTDMTPRDIAEKTIGEAVREGGGKFDALPETNTAAFGPLAFTYDPSGRSIVVSVLVTEFYVWTTRPNLRPRVEKTVAALNDPAVGGMFDAGGGTWTFDRKTGRLSLAATHDLTATPEELLASADALSAVHPAWSQSWLAEVGKIVHNDAPAPTRLVTVEDDPYR